MIVEEIIFCRMSRKEELPVIQFRKNIKFQQIYEKEAIAVLIKHIILTLQIPYLPLNHFIV